MRSLLAAIVGFATLILGETASADPPTPSSPPTLEHSEGLNCAVHYYPASAIRAGEQGPVLLTLSIDETGKVTKAEIAQSSGFADLDKAATDCVLIGWHYRPAMQNGRPIGSTKQVRIVWKIEGRRALLSGLPCPSSFSQAQDSAHAGNDTVLEYRIVADGTVDGAFVAVSSGDPDFDALALQCVSQLKYAPASTATAWGAEFVGTEHGLWFGDGHGVWNTCDDFVYPSSLPKENAIYTLILAFRVVEGGRLSDPAVEQSSGNSALDTATLECTRAWQHTDRLFFGPNLNVKMQAKVTWRNGHAFVLETLAQ